MGCLTWVTRRMPATCPIGRPRHRYSWAYAKSTGRQANEPSRGNGGRRQALILAANVAGIGLPAACDSGSSSSSGAHAGAYIYWADSTSTIGRANLNGTGVNQRFISQLRVVAAGSFPIRASMAFAHAWELQARTLPKRLMSAQYPLFCALIISAVIDLAAAPNGGSACVYWPSYHLVSVPAIVYVQRTLASVPLDIYAGHRVQGTRGHMPPGARCLALSCLREPATAGRAAAWSAAAQLSFPVRGHDLVSLSCPR